MIEAFEIGISLALADGVSEGIARAQKDADAVARAVAAGTVSVERLRQAGVAALTVVQPAARPSKGSGAGELTAIQRATQPTAGVRGDDAVGADPEPGGLGAVATPGEGVAPLLDRGRADPAAPPAASMNLSGKAVPDGDDGSGPSVERGEGSAALAQPASGGSYAAPVRIATSFVMPRALPIGTHSVAPMPAGPGDRGPARDVYRAPVAAAGESVGAGPLVGLRLDDYGSRDGTFTASGGWVAGPEGGASALAGGGAEGAAGGGTAHRAPVFVDSGNTAVAASENTAAVAAPGLADADASGGGAPPPGMPAQGDVFLDGALVGRWMSRHLSREAGRASAGPTGFDTRRNALLPGPTVGG